MVACSVSGMVSLLFGGFRLFDRDGVGGPSPQYRVWKRERGSESLQKFFQNFCILHIERYCGDGHAHFIAPRSPQVGLSFDLPDALDEMRLSLLGPGAR
jgi:hypothetical protein